MNENKVKCSIIKYSIQGAIKLLNTSTKIDRAVKENPLILRIKQKKKSLNAKLKTECEQNLMSLIRVLIEQLAYSKKNVDKKIFKYSKCVGETL